MNLNSACIQFIDHCRSVKKLSSHTVRAYQGDLTEFVNLTKTKHKQIPDIQKINKKDITDYVKYLFDIRMLKETSVKRKLACLKVLFRWLEIEERISISPFHRLDVKIKLPRRLPRNITSHELRQLLHESGGTTKATEKSSSNLNWTGTAPLSKLTTKLAIEILFATGIRVSELVSITLHAIDFQEGSIYINGKGKRERKVFITDQELLQMMLDYKGIRNMVNPETDFLLVNSRGGAASTQYIRKLIREAGEKAGLQNRITPHMFRHSCATQLLEAGVDIRFVQRLLGHESISTTEIYTQVCDTALKAIITRAATKSRLLQVGSDN